MNKGIICLILTIQCIVIGNVWTLLAEITHYPNVTLSDCGIGRESQLMDDSCFEWHNSRDISHGSIQNGRDVTDGEMPFVVLLDIIIPKPGYCTGVILNEDWVLTAAHCFGIKNLGTAGLKVEMRIYPGLRNIREWGNMTHNHLFSQAKIILPHEDLDTTQDYDLENDMVLLKLNESLQLSSNGAYSNINAVCLPQKGLSYRNVNNEYVLLSGWGRLNDTQENEGSLKMGQNIIDGFNSTEMSTLIRVDPGNDRTVVCSGDSGGPLIQYVGGRAVLLGTARGFLHKSDPDLKCPDENYTVYIDYISIGPKIDWIIRAMDWFSNS